MFSPKRVLVLFDFSESADVSLNTALWMARGRGGEIHLLYLERGLDSAIKRNPDSAKVEDVMEDTEGALKQAAEDVREKLTKDVPEVAGVPIHVSVVGGDLIDVTLSMVDELHIDLIITGTHGREGIMDQIRGSTSEQLVNKATCSVLVLKPDGYPYIRD